MLVDHHGASIRSALMAVLLLCACGAATAADARPSPRPRETTITLNQRIIELDGSIDLPLVKRAQGRLVDLASESHEPIWMRINSGGGSVEAGLILVDTMRTVQSPVHCVVESKAYSMAAIILVFCQERYALPHATIMLHEASYGTAGEDPSNRARLDFLTRYLDRLHEQIAATIRMPKDRYRARIRDAWWLIADEAADGGIIDAVVTGIRSEVRPMERTEQKDTLTIQSKVQEVPAGTTTFPKRR